VSAGSGRVQDAKTRILFPAGPNGILTGLTRRTGLKKASCKSCASCQKKPSPTFGIERARGFLHSCCHGQSQNTGNRRGLSRRNHGSQNFTRRGRCGRRDRGQSRLAAGDHIETPGWHLQKRPAQRFPGSEQRRAEKNLPHTTG
jgi:hypothetical protein